MGQLRTGSCEEYVNSNVFVHKLHARSLSANHLFSLLMVHQDLISVGARSRFLLVSDNQNIADMVYDHANSELEFHEVRAQTD